MTNRSLNKNLINLLYNLHYNKLIFLKRYVFVGILNTILTYSFYKYIIYAYLIDPGLSYVVSVFFITIINITLHAVFTVKENKSKLRYLYIFLVYCISNFLCYIVVKKTFFIFNNTELSFISGCIAYQLFYLPSLFFINSWQS